MLMIQCSSEFQRNVSLHLINDSKQSSIIKLPIMSNLVGKKEMNVGMEFHLIKKYDKNKILLTEIIFLGQKILEIIDFSWFSLGKTKKFDKTTS